MKTIPPQDEVVKANAINSALAFVRNCIQSGETRLLDDREEVLEQLEELLALTGRWAMKTRNDRRDINQWN